MLRRKKIIDKKFQLRTAFSIIGIILIGFILIIAVTGIIEFERSKKITAVTARMESALKQQNIPSGSKNNPAASALSASMNSQISELNRISGNDRTLFLVVISTAVALSAILYFYIINLTNRISGPIYVLGRHISAIMEGKEPDFRELRKNDEFQEFYAQFIAMTRAFEIKNPDKIS